MVLTDLEKKLLKLFGRYEVGAPEGKKNWSEAMVKKIVAKRKLLLSITNTTTDTRIYFIHKMQRTLIGISNEGFFQYTMHNESMSNYDFDEVFTGHWIGANSGMESSKDLYKHMPK